MSNVSDPYHFERFIEAQQQHYASALAELAGGRKITHWIWYIFPQMKALGKSSRSQEFGIGSAEEARAYLRHPVLGMRLRKSFQATLDIPRRTANQIFEDDDRKFRSCATLFASVGGDSSVFHRALDRFFEGLPDERTIALLEESP